MGYCSVVEVDLILAQALTSARPNPVGGGQIDLINIGDERDFNRIPNDIVEYYISLGDNQIDGILSQQYVCPLRKCANGEWSLDAAIYPEGTAPSGTDQSDGTTVSQQIVEVSTACNLVPGDEVLIRNDDTGDEESHIVNTILDQYRFTTVSAIETEFSGDNCRVIRIQYPPPINQISARYAASFIYDKYFAAQNDPNVSDYGKAMRSIAMGQINDILNGKVILKCQRRIGDRFGNPWLDDTYAHRDRGYDTSSRDMSKPE